MALPHSQTSHVLSWWMTWFHSLHWEMWPFFRNKFKQKRAGKTQAGPAVSANLPLKGQGNLIKQLLRYFLTWRTLIIFLSLINSTCKFFKLLILNVTSVLVWRSRGEVRFVHASLAYSVEVCLLMPWAATLGEQMLLTKLYRWPNYTAFYLLFLFIYSCRSLRGKRDCPLVVCHKDRTISLKIRSLLQLFVPMSFSQ